MLLPRPPRPHLLFIDIFNPLKYRIQELLSPLLLATHHPRARLRLYPDRRRGRKCGIRQGRHEVLKTETPPFPFSPCIVIPTFLGMSYPTLKPTCAPPRRTHPHFDIMHKAIMLLLLPYPCYSRLITQGRVCAEDCMTNRPARRPRRCRPT